jgi:hypothetical protein
MPKPAMVPVATAAMTLVWRKVSRAYGLEMCTSISGPLGRGVSQAIGVVGERPGIEHHRDPAVGRLVQPADHLALVVGLTDLDVETEFLARLLTGSDEPGVGGGAVHIRLSAAQAAEIGPIEDQDPRRHARSDGRDGGSRPGHRATSA